MDLCGAVGNGGAAIGSLPGLPWGHTGPLHETVAISKVGNVACHDLNPVQKLAPQTSVPTIKKVCRVAFLMRRINFVNELTKSCCVDQQFRYNSR